MHSQNSPASELEQYFDTPGWAHAPAVVALVLEPLPTGELAWLKPDDDESRYILTQYGYDVLRREHAVQALHGPWPSLSEASA